MSHNEAYDYKDDMALDSVWASCPADVLLEVFKQLDIQSLINCMDVNTYWRNLVEYYCEHTNLWKKIFKNSFDDEGATLAEKSKLNWGDQFQAAQQWLRIKNVNVTLRNVYRCMTPIRNICVHRDNLIINNICGVKYYNIDNFKLIKTYEQGLLKYEETSSMIVELRRHSEGLLNLFLTSKMNNQKVRYVCQNVLKVHMNRCYFVDPRNVLWMYTTSDKQGQSKFLARYYGLQDELCSIHTVRHNVYVLSKRGDVLTVDMECRRFELIFHLSNINQCPEPNYLYVLHLYHYTLQALNMQKNEECAYHYLKTNVAHKGLLFILEHGPAAILVYEDGKIEIYHKKTFTATSVPEMQFRIQNYFYDELMPIKIIAVDVYEDKAGHHLFVATPTRVFELLLYH